MNTKTEQIREDPPDTRLHASSASARRTTGTRIGRGGPYSDFRMSPPSHHPEEDTENPKTRNRNPPADEKPRSAIPLRREGPSEAAGPAATPTKGTETVTALGIASSSYFFLTYLFGLCMLLCWTKIICSRANSKKMM
jgi:hypothetical protein